MAASSRASARRLMERTYYDGDGQLLTGSYMDYAMPRADDAPMFAHRQPSRAGDDQSAWASRAAARRAAPARCRR